MVDTRDGAKYTVQIVHSAPLLLSMILVYGRGKASTVDGSFDPELILCQVEINSTITW